MDLQKMVTELEAEQTRITRVLTLVRPLLAEGGVAGVKKRGRPFNWQLAAKRAAEPQGVVPVRRKRPARKRAAVQPQ